MAISHAICRSFLKEILQGTHVIGTDTLRLALYSSSASLGENTTAYTTTGEVTGGGYTAGGATVQVTSGYPKLYPTAQGGVPANWAVVTDFTDVVFSSVSLTARGAMLYNSSKSNKAIFVLDFGSDVVVSGGNLTITWPTPDTYNAILRIT